MPCSGALCPSRIRSSCRDGHPDYRDDFDYPSFRRHRELLADQSDVMLVGASYRQDIIFAGGTEAEKIYRQHGAAAGLAAGMVSERFVKTLLFEVNATDAGIVALSILVRRGE